MNGHIEKSQIKRKLSDTVELQKAEIEVLKALKKMLFEGEVSNVISRIDQLITNKAHNTKLLQNHLK